MNHEKFHTFVKDVAKEHPALAESIISAHKIIFEDASVDEAMKELQ